jgi:RHH-type proline utilization regulon transcriptional repressor/proline dehydrogenase/delta 1-pyrroline-5-carboxylate dehydrogenase
VGGNAVILKPAEQAGACAAALFSILQEAGLDGDYLQLVPGIGEEVGAHLAAHPDVDFLVFTGSREVGLRIWESAARASALGRGPRKVVCEMGGKNAMIVDVGADPDEAIPAVLHSAFGYAGQKCSALSRLILLDRGHGKFLKRLLEAAESVRCGPALAPGTIVPAVIDATAKARLDGILGRARAEATVAFEGRVPGGEGHFVPPVILTDVAPDSWLTREEFFGPILTVQVARDLDEAFRWANGTDYALTGGVFSRSPSTLERARREFRAGNLYLNRAITGAMVERHPFGGYGMSGGGTKAGGPDMVREFLIPRAVSENCLRRGFAPE